MADGAAGLAGEGRDAVLAVVVATSGSTYRKCGALVLLDAGGVRCGALSGGCLEADLEDRARSVLDTQCAAEARFDTRDDGDRVFGSGSGCRGTMRVLLLPMPAASAPLRDALVGASERGVGWRLTLGIGAGHTGCGDAQVGPHHHCFGTDGEAIGAMPACDDCLTLTFTASPCVLLLGAGPETPFLLAMLRLLGWRTEVVERRGRWRDYARPGAFDRLHALAPEHLATLLERRHFDAALVMNHHFDLDAHCLQQLAATGVGYVGLLGPGERRDALLGELGVQVEQRLRPRLHAPVGLDLGGEGPEAIALAIVAELQNQLARGAAAHD
ncbi:MAG TPA: XdhC family protein [Rhodanobacteraceae bacterium]|nr:XdhC family protein [Rhodanobacteraceae bacterium]